jgi:mono/diheme cytochrome c family protein
MTRRFTKQLLALIAVGSLGACTSKIFDAPVMLGGKYVSAAKLNRGHDVYMNYCMQCHGVNGDGKGPAAQGMVPMPRNFQAGMYKFGNVGPGELPTDEDFKRIIRYGLSGTAMLPWDMSDEQIDSVTQFIKTFAPAWKEKTAVAGTPTPITPDPWGPAQKDAAILHGKKVYHGLAQCFTCHPSYAGIEEIKAASQELTGSVIASEIRPNPQISVLQGSSYDGHSYMPPDFTKIHIRSSRDLNGIYVRLATGVNGTSMPAWRGMLSLKGDATEDERNLWALAYYVQSLSDLKWDAPARKAFFADLNARR